MKIQLEINWPPLRIERRLAKFQALLLLIILVLTVASSRLRADTGMCSGANVMLPFTDVMGNGFFCQIAAAYFSGLTTGTTATTYSPGNNVTREQMAAFTTRTLDQSLRRGSRRAALNQWWVPKGWHEGRRSVSAGNTARDVVFDGEHLWVAATDRVERLRPGDGTRDPTFNVISTPAETLVVAGGRVYVAGGGTLIYIEKGSTVGTISNFFSADLLCLAFDGQYIWTGSNSGVIGRVSVVDNSIITAGSGFGVLSGMVYDGARLWVCEQDNFLGYLHMLAENGAVLFTVDVGSRPGRPVFDGMNIWVPNRTSNNVTVVRVKDSYGNPLTSPFVLATLEGNGLSAPVAAAFDGERILVTTNNSFWASLWKASDLSPLGSFTVNPPGVPGQFGACSDGLNFWVTIVDRPFVARF